MRKRRAAIMLLGASASAVLGVVTGGAAQPPADLFPPGVGPLTESGTVASCAGCHDEIVEEWSRSAHARSWSGQVFQSEYARAPQAFCRRCHAPRAADDDVRGVATGGIDCAVCHQRGGHVLGATGRGSDVHAVRVEPRLGRVDFCAACHEFAFPDRSPGGPRPAYLPGRPLQSTISEHRRSDASDEPCQSCHMPRRGDHVDHRFPGLNDPSTTRDAVRVRLRARPRADGALTVDVRLTPRQIGHSFPTGDMFREARFVVQRGPHSVTETLRRWFTQTPTEHGFFLAEVDDTRVPPDGSYSFSLRLPPGGGDARFRFEVWRLSPGVARERGLSEAQVRVPIASGRIRVPTR